MTQRREFFKQFIGQIGLLRDDFRGVVNIPLNRLNELPGDIIEEIEPIFFPDGNWSLQGNTLFVPESKSKKRIIIELNEVELEAFEYFKKGFTLKRTSTDITTKSIMSYYEIYQLVTSLFFNLASLRICHPKEAYNISEILNSNHQNRG